MATESARLPAIDVMVPVAPKDLAGLDACITGLITHSRNPIRSVNVVGSARLAAQVRVGGVVRWIGEESVSPKLAMIEATLHEGAAITTIRRGISSN